jgi:Predicted membrane protein
MELINTIFLCHFAIIGHIFPIWLKFKGGKGVATYIGFLFGMNLYIGLFFLLIWLFVSLLSKYSSLSSILASIFVPIFIVFFNSNSYIIIFLSYLSLIIILKHKENIRRLLNKTENKIKLFH